jgi:hypothetical protein
VCPTSFSNAGEFMMMASSQKEGIHVKYSPPTNKDPPEGKTMAVIAVMREAFPDQKYTKTPSSKKLRGCVNWGY